MCVVWLCTRVQCSQSDVSVGSVSLAWCMHSLRLSVVSSKCVPGRVLVADGIFGIACMLTCACNLCGFSQ